MCLFLHWPQRSLIKHLKVQKAQNNNIKLCHKKDNTVIIRCQKNWLRMLLHCRPPPPRKYESLDAGETNFFPCAIKTAYIYKTKYHGWQKVSKGMLYFQTHLTNCSSFTHEKHFFSSQTSLCHYNMKTRFRTRLQRCTLIQSPFIQRPSST